MEKKPKTIFFVKTPESFSRRRQHKSSVHIPNFRCTQLITMNESSALFGVSFSLEFLTPLTRDTCFSTSGSIAVLGVTTIFFALVVAKILPSFHHLFFESRGWSHRLFGAIHLGLLTLGAGFCWIEATEINGNIVILSALSRLWSSNKENAALWFDVLLGCSGVATTLTAAKDFPHRLVRNKPGRSGSLHQEAIVTQAEMIEHSFYQGLNLIQALYLHALYRLTVHFSKVYGSNTSAIQKVMESSTTIPISWVMMGSRVFCLWLVTAPWLLRNRFPIHGFSQNWSKGSRTRAKETTEETITKKSINTHSEQQSGAKTSSSDVGLGDGEIILYRIKKAQYLFYKHVILHGLNISVALSTSGPSFFSLFRGEEASTTNHSYHLAIPYGIHWRIFWLLLNTSYVMEFFLQTLVKRKILSQSYMLVLQKILMLAASLSAIKVLFGSDGEPAVVRPEICLLSLLLNFIHRHHDVLNTIGIALAYCVFDSVLSCNKVSFEFIIDSIGKLQTNIDYY